MNRQRLIALALAASAPVAFAQSSEADLQHFGASSGSTTTRAAVRADVIKARADNQGQVAPQADIAGIFQPAPSASTVTRAQRRAEVLQANKDGTLARPAVLGIYDTPVVSTRSREDVRQEAITATRNRDAARGVVAGH